MKKRQNFALKKCTKRVCTREDVISQLPDEILVYILSFLSVKEAADTSLISKRWLSLWTYISRLNFDATQPLEEIERNSKPQKRHMRKYVKWVNHSLQVCKVERLDQFRVRFDLIDSAQCDIDKWLEFAFARQVQRLELDLSDSGNETQCYDDCYTFPAQFLGGLGNNFKFVKVLLLKSVNVTGETLEFFLHNCLFLEEMVVHGPRSLEKLEVVGPSIKLKHLEIWWCINLKSLKISDTNLVTLGTSFREKLFLSNVPKLVEVDALIWPLRHILDEKLCWFSCALSQLEVLKIYSKSGLIYLKNYKFPELAKLKKFVLSVYGHVDMSLFGCTDIVGSALQLQEFELEIKESCNSDKHESRKLAVGCPHYNLKVLRLVGYHGIVGVHELIRYFLECAIALEKIIVDPRQVQVEEAQSVRNEIKLQLEGEVPPHIELVIL